MVSVQAVRTTHRAVLLIIRRPWVRAPPAPPAGRQPDSDVTVAVLLDQYVSTAGWDVSTRESNLGYIRRTIKPPLGSTQVRKVRGPLLDTLYARLMGCGNLACTGKPFTEHRNVRTSGPTRPTRATSAIGGPVSRTSRTAPYVKSRSNFLRISAIALSFL